MSSSFIVAENDEEDVVDGPDDVRDEGTDGAVDEEADDAEVDFLSAFSALGVAEERDFAFDFGVAFGAGGGGAGIGPLDIDTEGVDTTGGNVAGGRGCGGPA